MNSEQIALVQSSWEKVLPISETAAELFYDRLFETDYTTPDLFAGTDMKEQGQRLMGMIDVAVKGLNDLDTLVPAVQELGKRHPSYGVKAEHFDSVGAALLWTLEQGLGDGFTPDIKEAWIEVYNVLSGVMKEAGYTNLR